MVRKGALELAQGLYPGSLENRVQYGFFKRIYFLSQS